MIFSASPEGETLGEFELRLDRWLKVVAAEMPDLPQEALDYSRDQARAARVYRSCVWISDKDPFFKGE